MNTFKEYIFDRHNNYCNQKYADILPYSFHIDCVISQARKFEHLLYDGDWDNLVYPALLAHDILEDGRMTYGNLTSALIRYKYFEGKDIADIVYTVTDEKGKNRAERKNEKYYNELKENKLAIFVKLADISANTLYSKLTESSMYEKYKKEFPLFKEKVYLTEFEEFFNYVENL